MTRLYLALASCPVVITVHPLEVLIGPTVQLVSAGTQLSPLVTPTTKEHHPLVRYIRS